MGKSEAVDAQAVSSPEQNQRGSPLRISLGAWCRPAWQLRRHYNTERAYPFDWTITPFSSLQRILAADFQPDLMLQNETSTFNEFDSITDVYSGLLFHHDLHKSNFGRSPSLHEIESSRSKFASLFRRLVSDSSGRHVIAYRWRRGGHPDPEFAPAFEGETTASLYELVDGALKPSRLTLVDVMSVLTEQPEDEQVRVDLVGGHCSAVIKECIKSFRTMSDFRGDDEVWSKLFEAVDEALEQRENLVHEAR